MQKLTITLNEMLNAGVHFGHQVSKWNPKMRPYIYGAKAGVHIIDLCQTYKFMTVAMNALYNVVAEGGRVLFVGTKRQASECVAVNAQRCAQHFVNKRWLGGTLTNWTTVQKSLWRMENLEKNLENPDAMKAMTNKEKILMQRDLGKLEAAFGGLRNMGGLPNMLVVLDVHKDILAVQEARICGIPVIGIVDTNADPSYVDYPIPGNDDASSAIDMYCREMVATILQGLIAESNKAKEAEEAQENAESTDLGEVGTEEAPAQPAVAEEAPSAEVKEAPAQPAVAEVAPSAEVKEAPAPSAKDAKEAVKKAPEKKAAASKAAVKKAPAKKKAEVTEDKGPKGADQA